MEHSLSPLTMEYSIGYSMVDFMDLTHGPDELRWLKE
jgi:hypothetical protein